ncbi:hypothetical protein GINT2_001379 [Glugoides intestinalis]
MKDCKDILKEIKIDWHQALGETRNPLHLALKISSNFVLHKEFHAMLHRLEAAMEKIIVDNFQGFHDSFQIFSSYREKNKAILELYSKVDRKLEVLDLGDGSHKRQNADIKEIEAKYKICAMIVEARNHYKSFLVSEDPDRKAILLVKALMILSNQQLSQIAGVFEYYKIVLRTYENYMKEVHGKLLEFVIRNNIENIQYFGVILSLESITNFAVFCSENFYKETCAIIEEIIISLSENDEDVLDILCKKIAEIIERTLDNMQFIIKKVKHCFVEVEEKDFFGKRKSEMKFIFDISGCMSILKEIIKKFIEKYTVELEECGVFEIESTNYMVDISEVCDKKSSLYHRILSYEYKKPKRNTKFTLIAPINPETALILLKYIKNQEMRNFIHQLIESRLFSDASAEKKMEEINKMLKVIELHPFGDHNDLGATFVQILNSCVAVEEERKIKGFLKKKTFITFLRIFDAIFTSNFLKKPEFKDFLEKMCAHNDKDTKDDAEGHLKSVNYNAMNFIVPLQEFKSLLINEYIRSTSLFIKKEKYLAVYSVIETLMHIRMSIESKEADFLISLFKIAFTRLALIDFFYHFDLLYRQGNYSFYLRICCDIIDNFTFSENKRLDMFFKEFEECFDHYCRMNVPSINVKNKKELSMFIDTLLIFAEIVDGKINISKIIEFFKEVQNENVTDAQGRILNQKIS